MFSLLARSSLVISSLLPLEVGAQALLVSKDNAAPPPAAAWMLPLLGEYGRDSTRAIVLERDGHLHILYHGRDGTLSQRARERFAVISDVPADSARSTGTLPPEIRVRWARAGLVRELVLDADTLPRRQIGPATGGQLKVTPTGNVRDILARARTMSPPAETGSFRPPELAELTQLEPRIKLDIRYATTNNFLGTPFYSSARAFMQRPAAEALVRAHHALKPLGYGLLIHDAYRPWYVTRAFWDATPDSVHWLVANPASGSRHNRGSAVDLTLYDLRTGKVVPMVGTYDESTQRSLPDYPGGTSRQRWHRALLRHVMEAEGFTINPSEWWHFDYRDWRLYGIGNQTFEELRSHDTATPH